MVFTILGLLALILVTPSLLGRPPELSSLPLFVIGMSQDKSAFVLDVGGAIQAYMYANITLGVRGLDTTYNVTAWENDTYSVHVRVANDTAPFHVHTWLVDRQGNYFEYNVTVRLRRDDEGRTVMIFGFPDEVDGIEQIRVPPDDFRVGVPRRGAL